VANTSWVQLMFYKESISQIAHKLAVGKLFVVSQALDYLRIWGIALHDI
jgi:hypothetical protein